MNKNNKESKEKKKKFKIKRLTPEEKKKFNERKKKITKLTKSTKVLLFIYAGIYLLCAVSVFISYFNNGFAVVYNKIINSIVGLFFLISSYIPYYSYVSLVLIIIIVIANIILENYFFNTKKYTLKKLNKFINIVYKFEWTFIFLYLFSLIFAFVSLTNPIIDEILFEETKDKTYSVSDIENYLDYSLSKIENLSSTFNRDEDGKIIFEGNHSKIAINDLKRVSDKLPNLKGLYPRKVYDLIDPIKSIVGNDTVGLTHGTSIYVDYELDDGELLSVIMHEYCHAKGFARENETVFCSYVAGINSNENLSQYGGYMEGFGRTLDALSYFDIEKTLEFNDRFNSLCKKNYYEICNSRIRQNDYYLNDSYEMFIQSYSLRNYKDNYDELLDSINTLRKNNFEVKSRITGKKINDEEIIELINNDSYDTVSVYGKLDEKIFNNIKDAISDKLLFESIYQNNYEMEVSEVQKNNPTKFFLEPFEKDYKSLNQGDVVREFTYERVARLLLEYHEKYGY